MSEVHRIRCGNGNCYIIANGANAVLVDTGKKEYAGKVLRACEPSSVRLIVLTHAHFDHAENAAQISEALGVPIEMSEQNLELIGSNASQELFPKPFWGKLSYLRRLKTLPGVPCVPFDRIFC